MTDKTEVITPKSTTIGGETLSKDNVSTPANKSTDEPRTRAIDLSHKEQKYVVQEGDTIAAIWYKFRDQTSIGALMDRNNVRFKTIRVGQNLIIPAVF